MGLRCVTPGDGYRYCFGPAERNAPVERALAYVPNVAGDLEVEKV
jgi:hypothetical protein